MNAAARLPFQIVARKPSVEEYIELRGAAAWPVPATRLIETALSNSLFGVVASGSGGELIGMGRVVGDDAVYFHIQDVIVRPEWQGRDVGRQMMALLMQYVTGKGGKHTNVGLMCSKGREGFYRKFGFVDRPGDKFGAGMIMILD